MALIPRVIGPQVAATPEPSRQKALASYGVDQAAPRAIAAGLDRVAAVLERERQRADEIRTNEAEVEYRNAVEAAWADPEKGLAAQRGTKAVEGLDPFRDRLRSDASAVESRLSTDRQRALFRARADQIASDAEARALSHVTTEQQRADDQSHPILMAADQQALASAAAAGNDVGAEAAVLRMANRTSLYADRRGLAPEAVAALRTEAVSSARTTQVAALANVGTPTALERAAALLKDKGDQFTPEDRAKAQGVLGEAQERQAVLGSAARILSAKDADPKASTEAMLRDVPLEYRADVRKVVNGELDAREKERKQVHDDALLAATNRVERAGGKTARQVVEPTAWQSFSIAERDALERMARPDTIKHNDSAWMSFYFKSPTELKALSQADFQTQFWSKFDSDHRDRALKMWKDAQQPQGGGGASGLLSPTRRVERTFQQMFQQPPDKADWDEAQFGAFEQAADLAVMEASAAKGDKPLTDQELQAVLTRTATRMLTAPPKLASDDGWGEAFRAFAERSKWSLADQYGVPRADPEVAPRAPVPYAAIPAPASDTIAKQMREQGRGPTQDRIRRAYTALVLGDTVAYNAEVGTPPNPAAFAALRAGGFPVGMSPMTTVGKPWDRP